MTLAEIVGLSAGAFSVGGYIPYCIAIWNSKKNDDNTDPKLSSWIIWSISSTLLFASSLSVGTVEASYVAGAYFMGSISTLIICIIKRVKGWNVFDTICIGISVISVYLWWSFNSPFTALIINLVIDVTGGIPTLRSAIKNPEKENKLAWKLWFTGVVLVIISLILLKEYDIKKLLYPSVAGIIITSISYFVFMRKRKKMSVVR